MCFHEKRKNFSVLVIESGAYSRNLGQHSILARKGTFFMKKGHQKFHPLPLCNSFFRVSRQTKALCNFHKRGQRSTMKGGQKWMWKY